MQKKLENLNQRPLIICVIGVVLGWPLTSIDCSSPVSIVVW